MTAMNMDTPDKSNGGIDERAYQTYLDHLLKGSRRECSKIVADHLADQVPVKTLYEGMFRRSLYRVGELWEHNRISVAVEHMATAITEGLMNDVYGRLISGRRADRRVVVSSIEGEFHQVGGKMAADLFEMHGWDAYYLGANTPSADLIRAIRDIRPHVVGLSLSIYFHIDTLRETIARIRAADGDVRILVGGQAFRHGGLRRITEQPGVTYAGSLNTLERYIRSRE